ncbi:hypothetical protein AALP_AA8G267000 [Arabis alpina]|uniref:Uncharacterized protein n=1 Tax=Arabis alpina TaxID=50452 RepID=A0A087G9M9_ARAAL|nr:hypothetical protein AALP_AA8G267000 [Arabis alpina]
MDLSESEDLSEEVAGLQVDDDDDGNTVRSFVSSVEQVIAQFGERVNARARQIDESFARRWGIFLGPDGVVTRAGTIGSHTGAIESESRRSVSRDSPDVVVATMANWEAYWVRIAGGVPSTESYRAHWNLEISQQRSPPRVPGLNLTMTIGPTPSSRIEEFLARERSMGRLQTASREVPTAVPRRDGASTSRDRGPSFYSQVCREVSALVCLVVRYPPECYERFGAEIRANEAAIEGQGGGRAMMRGRGGRRGRGQGRAPSPVLFHCWYCGQHNHGMASCPFAPQHPAFTYSDMAKSYGFFICASFDHYAIACHASHLLSLGASFSRTPAPHTTSEIRTPSSTIDDGLCSECRRPRSRSQNRF